MRVRQVLGGCIAMAAAAGVFIGATQATEPTPPITEQPVGWTVQFGTAEKDNSDGSGALVATAANGDVYAAVGSNGAFPGLTPSGDYDVYLMRFNSSGTRQWLRQLATPAYEIPQALAVAPNGDVYVVGYGQGALNESLTGADDAFVARFDKRGVRQWVHQFGATGVETYGYAIAVSPNGDVFVGGSTWGDIDGTGPAVYGGSARPDAFVVKFDRRGNRKWSTQFGGSDREEVWGLAAGGGNVYVAGTTTGSLTTPPSTGSAYLAKLDKNGVRVWTKQFGGGGPDMASTVAVSGKAVYVGGRIYGDIDTTAGNQYQTSASDAFVARYDTSGNLVWARQLGVTNTAIGNSVAVSRRGDVYLAGIAVGDIDNDGPGAALGGSDGFVARYSTDGVFRWVRALGTSTYEDLYSVAVTSGGRPVVGGDTEGTLWGHANAGKSDGFLTVLPR